MSVASIAVEVEGVGVSLSQNLILPSETCSWVNIFVAFV